MDTDSTDYSYTITPLPPRTLQDEIGIARTLTCAFFTSGTTNTGLERAMEIILMNEAWTENIAREVLKGLMAGLKGNAAMGPTMANMDKRARQAANAFAVDQTLFLTMYALGFLVMLAPDAVRVLGFREWLELKGSFAGAWRAAVAEIVPRPALFWFFLRLDMPWTAEEAVVPESTQGWF